MTDLGITNPIFSLEISVLGIMEPLIVTAMVASIAMVMVRVMHQMLEASIGVLNKVLTCGPTTQHNGRIAMVMAMETMVPLEQPILISSRTISQPPKTTIPTVILIAGHQNTMAPMP